ncbi:MAG: phosphotransferase [Candidatus Kariarchaeaceae archaeon]|jgi:thiamine kinase-like enzyme
MVEGKIYKLFERKDIQVTNIKYIGTGINSSVYRISGDQLYGLKIAKFPERRNKVLNEIKIREEFINKGVKCIPDIYFSDTEFFPDSAVVYQFIDGKQPDFENKEVLSQFAKILAGIHRLELKMVENGYDLLYKNYQSLVQHEQRCKSIYTHLVNDRFLNVINKAIAEVADFIEKRRKYFGIGLESQLHGDLSDNFLVDDSGKIWLIDWENSEYGDVFEEICFFANINLDEDNLDHFIEQYKQALPITRDIDFKHVYESYTCMYPLFYIFWNLDFINTYLKNNLPISEKLEDLNKAANMCEQYLSKSTATDLQEVVSLLPIV